MRKFFELLKDPTNEIMDVSWLRVFLVDKLIYDGKYQLVIQKTQLEGECSVAAYIERAVAFYALANFSKACEQVRLAAPLAAPSCLAPSFGNEIFLESSSSCHKLGLINGTNEVISFIVSVIISCLCDAKLLKNPTDRIIGVIFVLSQMEWPLYRSLLTEMVCAIQMAKGLLWPGLIDYICLMDHLEQLSSLNHNHDDLALQIVKNSYVLAPEIY